MEKASATKVLSGTDKLWDDMEPRVKLLFLCKLGIMLASCGYIYGNLLTR